MADLIERKELKDRLAKEIDGNAMRNIAGKEKELFARWEGYHNGLMMAYAIVLGMPEAKEADNESD